MQEQNPGPGFTAAPGRGRRRAQADKRRDIHFTVRLTRAERDALTEAAGGAGGLGELMRAAAFRRAARLPVRVPEINREAWTALARSLANLHQIAAALNRGDAGAGRALAPVLAGLRDQVAALRAALIAPPTRGGGDADA